MIRVRWLARAAYLVAAVGALVALPHGWRLLVATRTPAAPPNILLITLDTTRADHLGAYGDTVARTPHLDRLAFEGVLFERAVSAAPITLPAHVSLLTGQYPFAHGVRNNGNFRLAENVPTLATVLHDHGYRTAAFVSAFVLDRRTGLSRGFDAYDDQLDAAADSVQAEAVERRGDRTAQAAGTWLASHGGQPTTPSAPFFVWIHLYDPHDPYTPPPPFNAQFPDRPYDGEIAFDDDVIGSLLTRLDGLGLLSSTIVAVVGDHGESLGEHDEATHAIFVYNAVLRIPFIVRWPGHLASARVMRLVRSVDLAPTLLELTGLPPLREIQGESLLPLIRGGGTAPESAYAETYFPLFFMNWAPLRSIQEDRWKFIDAPVPELYDLTGDPDERTNLAAREPARAAALRQALDRLTGAGDGAMTAAQPDRDTAEKLAALGYIGAGGVQVPLSSGASRPDPKAMIGVFNQLRAANGALSAGHPADAERTARAVLIRDGRNAFATLILAKAELQLDRCEDALTVYRRYAELVPSSADAHYGMALCHARLGRSAPALAEASTALQIDPRYVSARVLRGGLLTERGRLEEAAADYQNAIELQPSNAEAHSGYGVLLAARNEPDRAIAELQRALELRPQAGEVRLALAGILERAGRSGEARAQYEELARNPNLPAQLRETASERLLRR